MTQYKTSTPARSQNNEKFLNALELDKFWDDRPFEFDVGDRNPILSWVQRIPTIDPLGFLDKFTDENNKSFYWENPTKQEAIAAYGITRELTVNSGERFDRSQNFIESCFKQIIHRGETSLIGSSPRILCSFSFFNNSLLRTSNSFPSATIFLPRFQVVKKNKNYFFVVNFPFVGSENVDNIIAKIRERINKISWEKIKSLPEKKKVARDWHEHIFDDRKAKYFKSVVISALSSIEINEMSKIVIADATDIKSPKQFQITESLNNLRYRHSDCYTFSISNGRGQNFIGASPERLVSIQNKQLVTDALAGSAPRGKNNAEDVKWSNLLLKSRKEKREHQAVSDFLIRRLQELGLKPYQLPLQLLQLSNIQHLWTPVYAQLPKEIKPLELVRQLHPSPAVAGVPSKVALDRIRHYEKFDRTLYAALLGWIDSKGNCEFIVGIRSALIEGNSARLYAGAGIVSGSSPDKELAEIKLKLQSLLKALV